MEEPEALRNEGLEQTDAGVVMMGLRSEPYGPDDTDERTVLWLERELVREGTEEFDCPLKWP
jgi:hypothetical protein